MCIDWYCDIRYCAYVLSIFWQSWNILTIYITDSEPLQPHALARQITLNYLLILTLSSISLLPPLAASINDENFWKHVLRMTIVFVRCEGESFDCFLLASWQRSNALLPCRINCVCSMQIIVSSGINILFGIENRINLCQCVRQKERQPVWEVAFSRRPEQQNLTIMEQLAFYSTPLTVDRYLLDKWMKKCW